MEYHDLEKMTVVQLREEVKKLPDVKGVTAMKKEELIHALVEHLGITVPEKTKEKKRKSGSAPLDKPALKKKLAELRAAKSAAQAANDRKSAHLLRRRIHIIKRRVRKSR
jgi:cell division protein FtsX